jgi:hypothetical protein
MEVLILSIIGLIIIVLIITKITSRKGETAEESESVNLPSEDCCGEHEVCEAESLMNHTNKPIYYDDEELDRFAQKTPETYTIEEMAEFQNILYTLKEDEVSAWLKSLQLRNIELPLSVREEALLIVSERRFGTS